MLRTVTDIDQLLDSTIDLAEGVLSFSFPLVEIDELLEKTMHW